ncbi:MAG: hypothetical protein ACOZBH_04480 [Patescibacteria group bacterium]
MNEKINQPDFIGMPDRDVLLGALHTARVECLSQIALFTTNRKFLEKRQFREGLNPKHNKNEYQKLLGELQKQKRNLETTEIQLEAIKEVIKDVGKILEE